MVTHVTLEMLFKKTVIRCLNNLKLIKKNIIYSNLKDKYEKLKQIILNITISPIIIIASDIDIAESIYKFILDNISEVSSRVKLLHCASDSEEENYLISRSGILGNILISTNIIGRGIDIKIGGDIEFFSKFSFISLENIKSKIEFDKLQIESNGGLHIILWERFEDERIDLQALGRTARQNMTGTIIIFENKNKNKNKQQLEYSLALKERILSNNKLSKMLELSRIIFRSLLFNENIKFLTFFIRYFLKKIININKIDYAILQERYNLANN